MNLSGLSERDQKTLRVGGVAVAVILALMVVVLPMLDYLDKLNKDAETKTARLRSIESSVQNHLKWNALRAGLKPVASLYPSAPGLNEQMPRMLQSVERLPSYGKLSVDRLENLPLREEENFYRSGLSMQFGGTLEGLQEFLEDMEKAEPALKVDRLTVSTDTRDASRIGGSMVINAFAVVEGKSTSR